MKRVIALGFFDGVHLGHGALLKTARALASELEASPAALTFDVSPQEEILGERVPLLSGVEDRKALIREEYGIETVLVLHFDRALREQPAELFFRRLITEFGAVGLVCGDDFRFGRGGAGDRFLLRELCEESGIALRVVPEVTLHGRRVSSTLIRSLLEGGDLEAANEYLGHPHRLSGTANPERAAGFPSIRVVPDSGVILPQPGLYDALLGDERGNRFAALAGVGEHAVVSRLLSGGLEPLPERLTVEFLRYLGE